MNQSLEYKRHTLAHLLAKAVSLRYPHAKATLGPAVENGFYYDFDFSGGKTPGDSDLKAIEKDMRKILSHWTSFSHREVSAREAKEFFKDNPYKLELIEDIEKRNKPITFYSVGEGAYEFTDLCRGGHSHNPAEEISPQSFKLDSIAGAYWRGDEKNPMLTRIYGVAFENKEELDMYLMQREEAKKRDHRKLGRELDLFIFSDLVGSGLPLFTPRGTLLRDLVVERIMRIQKKYGYQKVTIPHITKKELYQTSGHWEKFGDELFKVYGKNDAEFVMKPMNCPHHTQLFAGRPRSYKELPVRFAETTMVYRDEQQGELIGLSRVRSITQDDGHVFCTFDQIEQEVEHIVSVIKEFYTSLNMYEEGKFWVSLSVRDPQEPEKYLGDAKKWNEAEDILESVAKHLALPYTRVPGEAAFYGPKLDFVFYDALDRERQLATAQLDFVMPERFSLEYIDRDGTRKTPVMIHRAIAGSLERFMAIMIEHFAGAFPFWLSPEQVRIVPVAKAHIEYAHTLKYALEAIAMRVSVDESDDSLGKKIRNARREKVPYTLVVGEKEIKNKTATVESRDDGTLGMLTIAELLERFARENQ